MNKYSALMTVGLVKTVLAFYSNDQSFNPIEIFKFSCKIAWKEQEVATLKIQT